MSCKIKYNNDKPVAVEKPNGAESELFKDTFAHPAIENFEDALNMYKNMYTEKFYQKEENYTIANRVGKEVMTSYKKALETGKDIEVGYLDNSGNFISIKKVKPSFDISTQKGFINTFIKDGFLSDIKLINNGESYFQSAGKTQSGSTIKADMVRQEALVNLGWKKFQKTPNGFTFNEITDPNSFSREQTIIEREIGKILRRTKETKSTNPEQKLTEDELRLRLLDLLDKMGVSVVSMSDYIEKHNVKNGVDPEARALADIANQIVAFADGKIDTKDLAEETAHFIVESWNQDEISNLLSSIHKTPQWAQHAQRYTEIYSQDYSGQELDTIVRKEILGKVLADSLVNNFQTEDSSSSNFYIINKIKELFNKFIDFIKGNTTQSIKQQLDGFTEQVTELLYENQIASFISTENFNHNKNVMYSVGSEKTEIKGMRAEVLQGLKFLQQTIRSYGKSAKGIIDSQTLNQNIKKLQELGDKEGMLLQKQAAIDLLAVADSQANFLLSKIRDKEDYTFGAEENSAYQSLIRNVDPLINSMGSHIRQNPNEYPPKEWAKVEKNIKEVSQKISDLKADSSQVYKGTINAITERIMRKHNLGESYRENINDWLEAAHKDTTMFHRYFGQIVNSNDPLLGLMSEVNERTHNGANREYVDEAKTYHTAILDLGVKEKDLKEFFDKGFLLDEFDHAKIEDFMNTIRAESRKVATGEKTSIEDIKKKAEDNKLEQLSTPQEEVYMKEFELRRGEFQQRYFTDAYYQEKQDNYDKLGIHRATINTIRNYSAARSELVGKAKDGDIIDYSRLSQTDRDVLQYLKRKRANDKSFFNSDGSLKKGISYVLEKPQTGRFVEERGLYYIIDETKATDKEADEEAVIAMDLHFLDKNYSEKMNDGDTTENVVPQMFKDRVKQIEDTQGKDAALDFIESNASIFFNQDFWEDMSSSSSYTDRLSAEIRAMEEGKEKNDALTQLGVLRNFNNVRASLLKKYNDTNKPFEIDASKMDSVIKQKIRELDEEIQKAYREISKVVKLPEETQEGAEEKDPNFTNDVNQSYLDTVEERGYTTTEEVEFIEKNTSKASKDRIASFRTSIDSYLAGDSSALKGFARTFIESYTGVALNEGDTETLIRDFARTQVASYYKRLIPNEYLGIFNKKEAQTAQEYLKSLEDASYVEISPNYSFLEQDNSNFINPSFDTQYEGSIQVKKGDIKYGSPVFNEDGSVKRDQYGEIVREPKEVNFESEKYKNMFGKVKNGKASNNQAMYEALQLTKDLQRGTLKDLNLEGRHNLYKLPQITKKGIDRAVDMIARAKSGGLRQGIQELFKYRVDDIEYGETVKGTNISTIPTYYTRSLENKEELSDELFYSFLTMRQQAILHKHRKKNIGEALAIKDALEKRESKGNRKVEAKNTMEMFDNYMDFGFFGKNESKEYKINLFGQEVDITKTARLLLGFIKFRNLAFSAIVGATSYVSSEVNLQIEKRVGEIINTSSERLGRKAFARAASGAVTEMGKLKSKSELNTLGEYFGLFDLNSRFEGSNYNYVARNVKKMGFANHQMANFPITPRAMYATLHDFRIDENGSITNEFQYKRDRRNENPDITEAELKADWAKTEGDVIYNYLEVEDGVRIKPSIMEKLAPELRTNEYLEEKLEAITDKVKRAATQLDTQITSTQRTAAQRHFAMNYLMTHRGWLSVVISNRTKNAHYNTMTGIYEEGSYRSFYSAGIESIKAMVSKKNIMAFKDVWNGEDLPTDGKISKGELLATRRRNLKRVARDTAFMTGLSAITYALLSYADDDEDNPALQFVSYLALRVLNEQVSGQTGIPYQLYETLKSPFVGLGTVADLVTLPFDLFDSEVIKSGKYRGETKRLRALKKTIPGFKTIDDMTKLSQSKDTYYFYNSNNLLWNPVSALMVIGLEDE